MMEMRDGIQILTWMLMMSGSFFFVPFPSSSGKKSRINLSLFMSDVF